MAHARWIDIIAFAIAGFIGVGVYGLFLLFGQQILGSIFALITWCGCCIFEYWLPSALKKKKLKNYSSQQPQTQKISSNEIQKVSSTSAFNGRYTEDFKYCPKCAAKMKLTTKYCYECGFQFTD